MSLKELTKDKHAAAEGTKFMRAVFDQTLPMSLWQDYTYQKYIWYRAIEDSARRAGLLDQLPGIERAELIMEDYEEMVNGEFVCHIYKTVSKDYVKYIESLTDPVKIMAHLYTWHMGDMFGGQMIKKIIEAPHRHLEFDNVKDLMFTVRGMLDDNMAEEANTAFDWAIRILQAYDRSLE